MARRLSTGVAGRNVLGSFVAVENNLRSVVNNADVVLQANGTGIARSTTHLQIDDANSLRLADNDSSNYVALTAPATVASNVTFTLPSTDGSANQALITDGNGVLSFANNFLQIQNRTSADNNTYYVAMADSTSGTEDTLSIADGRLEFVPNPGRLSAAEMRATASTTSNSTTTGALVVTGGVGIGGQMTAVSIVETSSIALKENITPIQNGLDSVLKLTGVTYDRKDNGEHESGLIAEWVEEVLPELVTRGENGNVVGIKYTKLSAYLIEAIKTLKKEIDSIKGNN